MEWLLTNTQIQGTFASLGSVVQGDHYVPSRDCLEILHEINHKLEREDQSMRSFRRAIGFGQNVRNDIIPLLVNARDPKIMEASTRLLVNLTIPVECLMRSDVDTIAGRQMVFELNKLLIQIKESFTDAKATKSILDYMKLLLDDTPKSSTLKCEEINNCLLLLRNILNIPDHLYNLPRTSSMQNQILWNLFTQSLDRILLQVMTSPESSNWCVTIVQLIALIYKDQHVNTLQKMLSICFDATISDSSDDIESNTSLVKGSNIDSSPLMTSDPTSDSSDNGGKDGTNQIEERRNSASSPSELSPELSNADEQNNNDKQEEGSVAIITDDSDVFPVPAVPGTTAPNPNSLDTNASPTREMDLSDCGYATQVENNPESNSTSSSAEDSSNPPVHQKPPASNQKKRMNLVNKPRKVLSNPEKTEWRRKKLLKRGLSHMINMKGMANHTPTDDDITNIMKEFSVDFLLKGYGTLIDDLHNQLMTPQIIDTSHFFWLVTYFLKFTGQLELDLGHVHSIFTFDIVGYCIYEAASISEQLDSSRFDQVPSSLRRLHLSVTAIKEFLQAIEAYKKIGHLMRPEDVLYLKKLEYQIASSGDLKNLFILLLRRFNPSIQSKQYLQDVVVTNHHFLNLLDKVSRRKDWSKTVPIENHIKEFATVEIMYWFGYLLEDFHDNAPHLNDIIFTMLHHIAGDYSQVSLLFQPIILRSFSRIWETEFEMCEDWTDLVEYVINKFINKPLSAAKMDCVPMEISTGPIIQRSDIPTKENSLAFGENPCQKPTLQWTDEELDSLLWFVTQHKAQQGNLIENIQQQFEDNDYPKRTAAEIVNRLVIQGILTEEESSKYLPKKEEPNSGNENTVEQKQEEDAMDEEKRGTGEKQCFIPQLDDVENLSQKLMQECPQGVQWLQQVLLDCAFVKLLIVAGVTSNKELMQRKSAGQPRIMEPILLINALKKHSIPLIPWTNDQLVISMYHPFVLLLHKLGFHLGPDAQKQFVRIPEFWTHEHIYSVACKLGPVPQPFKQRTPNDAESAADSNLMSDGYPGQDTSSSARRTSAYSGMSTNPWMDSPTTMAAAVVRGKKRSDSSQISGATDTSGDVFSSHKDKDGDLDGDGSSAAAVMDEEEIYRDAFGVLTSDDEDSPKRSRPELVAVDEEIHEDDEAAMNAGMAIEAIDSTSVWETASQVCSSVMLCVSDEENL